MELTRRDFIKIVGIGFAGMALSPLGFAEELVAQQADGLKISGAKEVITVCPFCSVCCHIIAHVKDGRIVSTEGDPNHPINEGALCAKGSAMLSMVNSDRRIYKPLYRAPYSDKWEEKSWDWMFQRIAEKVKETRDAEFITNNQAGKLVNRTDSMFFLGSSQMSNEECTLTHQAIRGMGIVHIDHQARI